LAKGNGFIMLYSYNGLLITNNTNGTAPPTVHTKGETRTKMWCQDVSASSSKVVVKGSKMNLGRLHLMHVHAWSL
jgi:hypothetical protein